MNSDAPFGPASLVARNEEPIAVEVDRSVVMMSLDQGMYFGLEGTGPRIWALLEQPKTVQQLCDDLMLTFDVDRETCLREVCAFLEERVEPEDTDLIGPPCTRCHAHASTRVCIHRFIWNAPTLACRLRNCC